MPEDPKSRLTQQQATDQKVLPPLKSKPKKYYAAGQHLSKDHMLESGDGNALMVNLASIGQIKRLPPSLAQQSANAQPARRVEQNRISKQAAIVDTYTQAALLQQQGRKKKKRKVAPAQPGRQMMQISNASPNVLHSGESDGGAPFNDGHSSSVDHQYGNLPGGRVQGRFQSSLPPQRDGFNASAIQGSGDPSLQRAFRGTHGPLGNLPQHESFNQKRRGPGVVGQTSEDEFEQFDRDLDNEEGGLSTSQAQTHKQGQLSSLIAGGDDFSLVAVSPERKHIELQAPSPGPLRSSVQRFGAVNNMSVAPGNEAVGRASQQVHAGLLAGSSLKRMEGIQSPQKSYKNSGQHPNHSNLSQVADKPPKIRLGMIGATGPSPISDRLTKMFENSGQKQPARGGIAALYSRRVSLGSGQQEAAATTYELQMAQGDGTQDSRQDSVGASLGARQFLTSSQRRQRQKRPSIVQVTSPAHVNSRKVRKDKSGTDVLGDIMSTPISSRDIQPWPVDVFSGNRPEIGSGGRMAFANQTDGFVPAQQTRPLVSRGGSRGKVNVASRRDSSGYVAKDRGASSEQVDEFGLPLEQADSCEPSPNARQHRPRIGGRPVNHGIKILSFHGGEPLGAGLQQSNSKIGDRNGSIGAIDNTVAREDPSSLRTPFRVGSRRQGSRRGEGSGDKVDANWASRLLASAVAEHGRPPDLPSGTKYTAKEDRPQTRGNKSHHGGAGGTAGGACQARSGQRSRRLPGRPVALKALSPAEGGTSEALHIRSNDRGMGSFEAPPRQADPDEFGPPLDAQLVGSPGNERFNAVPDSMLWSHNIGDIKKTEWLTSGTVPTHSPEVTPGRTEAHGSRNRLPLPSSSAGSNQTKILNVSQIKFAPGAQRPARLRHQYENQTALARPTMQAADFDARYAKFEMDGNAVTGGEYRSNASKDRLPSGASMNNAPNMGSSSEGGAPQATGASTSAHGATQSSKRTSQHMYAQQYGLIGFDNDGGLLQDVTVPSVGSKSIRNEAGGGSKRNISKKVTATTTMMSRAGAGTTASGPQRLDHTIMNTNQMKRDAEDP